MRNPQLAVGAFLAVAAVSLVATWTVLGAGFVETFDGAPATPQAMDPANFEVIRGGGWTVVADGPAPDLVAQHGPNCEPPGDNGSVRHSMPTREDMVFGCANHLMTYVPGDVSFTYLTPNQLLDLSSGTATVKWDVSTLSLSTRDWISVFVQGWDTQQQRVLDETIPANQGNPRNAFQVEQGGIGPAFESGSGLWHIEQYDGAGSLERLINDGCCGRKVFDVAPMSAQTRTTFQIDFTPGHVRLWLPAFNYTLAEGDIAPFTWTQGVVTFAHHSYSPDKGYNPACERGLLGTCDQTKGEANTWHWDNLSVSPAVPFTIIKPDHRSTRTGSNTFQFAQPAPANAIVRFEAWGDEVRVSFDSGPEVVATRTTEYRYGEAPSSFIVPAPQGITRATFTVTPSWCCAEVNNPHVFARDGGVPSTVLPTSTATPTPIPTPTASPAPTATPTPVPTPEACRVYLRSATGGWTYSTTRGSYQGTMVAGECRR